MRDDLLIDDKLFVPSEYCDRTLSSATLKAVSSLFLVCLSMPLASAWRISSEALAETVSSRRCKTLSSLLVPEFVACLRRTDGRDDEGATWLIGNEGGKLAVFDGALVTSWRETHSVREPLSIRGARSAVAVAREEIWLPACEEGEGRLPAREEGAAWLPVRVAASTHAVKEPWSRRLGACCVLDEA